MGMGATNQSLNKSLNRSLNRSRGAINRSRSGVSGVDEESEECGGSDHPDAF